MKRIAFAILIACVAASGASAGKIERACKKSERNASASTCKCIQKVANSTLTRSDRKLAAKFFSNPQLAQDTRQSNDARKESFWKRYKKFGSRAAKTCN